MQLGEEGAGSGDPLLERLGAAERAALEERLETSHRQIRDYQATLHLSQEQMDGAQAIIDSEQVGHGCSDRAQRWGERLQPAALIRN